MISRYRIALNGVQLDSLDNNLLILDIGYSAPAFQITPNRIANLDGFDYGRTYNEKQTVTVTFELHIYDVNKRNEACQKINKWASEGGNLTVNDRKDQRLVYTRCEQYASIESVRNWTDPLTLVFSTTYIPYWQSVNAKTLTLTGTNAGGYLKLDGNISSALVRVEVVPVINLKSFTITIGGAKGTRISLADENRAVIVESGKTLLIDYINGRILRIRADGNSIMNKLSADSSDVLLAPCGTNSDVAITSSGRMTATVSARGLWL